MTDRSLYQIATWVLILTLGLATPSQAKAQTEAVQLPGFKGPIDREQLIEQLQVREVEVEGYIISGDDLRTAIETTDKPVRLSHCVIKGGLRLPAVVSARIEITDCTIEPAPLTRALWAGTAVYAREVKFNANLEFSNTRINGPAVFTGAQFAKLASFSDCEFTKGPSFSSARFSGWSSFLGSSVADADFTEARFDDDVSFSRVLFGEGADFTAAEFRGKKLTSFRKATFEGAGQLIARFLGPVNFRNAQFKGDALFSANTVRAEFEGTTDFKETVFGGNANFENVIFTRAANFEGASFQSAVFTGVTFESDTLFTRATFITAPQFQTHFRSRAGFQEVRFQEDAYFSPTRENPDLPITQFDDEADFSAATFGEQTYFGEAVFSGDAIFRSTHFGGDIVFRNTVFHGLAVFQGVEVSGTLDLRNTIYRAYADLREARIGSLNLNSSERPTIVTARFDMRGARLGETHFEDVIFEQEVDVSDAAFGVTTMGTARGTTVFRFVTFESLVSFARAHFEGPVVLENVKFQDVADFTDTHFLPIDAAGASFALSYVDFSELRIHWSQLPPTSSWVQGETDGIQPPFGVSPVPRTPEQRSRVLESLEKIFRDQGQLADANHAYFQRKRTELMEARREGHTWRRLQLEAEWLFWGVTTGYGTQLGWIVFWAALVNLFFTLVYWAGATIHRAPHPEAELEHSFQLRLLDFPKQYLMEKHTRIARSMLVDALLVSTVILFKMGYRDTSLSGTIGRVKVSTLVRVEWALGYFILAALTITLTNTQPLLNSLITGLF